MYISFSWCRFYLLWVPFFSGIWALLYTGNKGLRDKPGRNNSESGVFFHFPISTLGDEYCTTNRIKV